MHLWYNVHVILEQINDLITFILTQPNSSPQIILLTFICTYKRCLTYKFVV